MDSKKGGKEGWLFILPIGISLIYILAQLAVGSSFIAIGSLNLNTCSIESMIPQWLLIYGSEKIFYTILITVVMVLTLTKLPYASEELKDLKTFYTNKYMLICIIVSIIFHVFAFAWTIYGSVLVYSKYSKIIEDSSASLCNKSCYYLAFSFITIHWILIGLYLFVILSLALPIVLKSKKVPDVKEAASD